ncbi:hypothetical protein KIW84_076202, partial [Lathyrus oleraceus]
NNVFENSPELLPSPYDEIDHLQLSMIPAHIQIQPKSKDCSCFIYGICFPDEDSLIEYDFDYFNSTFDMIKNLGEPLLHDDDYFDYDDSFMDYIMAELMKHGARVGPNYIHILEVPSCKEKPSLIQDYLEY